MNGESHDETNGGEAKTDDDGCVELLGRVVESQEFVVVLLANFEGQHEMVVEMVEVLQEMVVETVVV